MGNFNTSNADGSVGFGAGQNRIVETITADRTLTAADSGKTFLIATDGLTVMLPATVKGLDFEFINTGAAGNNINTILPASTDGI
jgi:hypothetical protein